MERFANALAASSLLANHVVCWKTVWGSGVSIWTEMRELCFSGDWWDAEQYPNKSQRPGGGEGARKLLKPKSLELFSLPLLSLPIGTSCLLPPFHALYYDYLIAKFSFIAIGVSTISLMLRERCTVMARLENTQVKDGRSSKAGLHQLHPWMRFSTFPHYFLDLVVVFFVPHSCRCHMNHMKSNLETRAGDRCAGTCTRSRPSP